MLFPKTIRFVADHPEHGRVHIFLDSTIDYLVHLEGEEEMHVFIEAPGHLFQESVMKKTLSNIRLVGFTNFEV